MQHKHQTAGDIVESYSDEIWAPVHCPECPSVEGIFISTLGRMAKMYVGPSPYSGKGAATFISIRTETNVKKSGRDIVAIVPIGSGTRKISLTNIYRNAFIISTHMRDRIPSVQQVERIGLEEMTPAGIIPIYQQYGILDSSMWNNRNDTSKHKILSSVPGRPIEPLSEPHEKLITGAGAFCETFDGQYVDASGLFWRPIVMDDISPLAGYWISAVGDVVKLDTPLNHPSSKYPIQRDVNCRLIHPQTSKGCNVGLKKSDGVYRSYSTRRLVYQIFIDPMHRGVIKCIFKKYESSATHLITKTDN
jgi:hypothetical protein